VGKAIYAIDAFPDDAQLWRIDWIGGVAYNASVPSEPVMRVLLAALRLIAVGPVEDHPAYTSITTVKDGR
jgi:hypothetical protein